MNPKNKVVWQIFKYGVLFTHMDNFDQKKGNDPEKGGRINILEFADLTISDTEELKKQIFEAEDIGYITKEILESLTFDSTFRWPEKLPEGFDPERLIEESKDPGLGIRKLHEQGITGKGITVAIIDQKISAELVEFKDNLISNREYNNGKPGNIEENISMHGPAVASLFVGKNCGVAPDAKLIYEAVNSSKNSYFGYIKAIEDIIEYNKNNKEKIKIVSVSKGHQTGVPGLKEWIEIKEKAKDSGLIVIDSRYFVVNGITGGGSKTSKDKFDNYEFPLFYKETDQKPLTIEDVKKKLAKADGDLKKRFFEKYKSIEDFINTRGEELLNDIIVPSDYRTMASREGNNEYRYEAKGGWSWAIPYFAGVFALALQVNPDLTNEKFLEIIKKTAGASKKGFKVINPEGIIKEVKKTVSENKQKIF